MRHPTLCVAAALAWAVAAGPLWATNDSLRIEMDEMAKEVAANLRDLPNPVDRVVVGDFTGPATQETSGGSLISMVLTEALKKHGVKVGRPAEVGIKGEYEDVKDMESGNLAIRVSATCTHKSGKKLFECQKRGAFGESLVASVMGVSAKLPPTASGKERTEILEKALEAPKCHVAGSTVCCTPQSQYAVEILVAAPAAGDGYAPPAEGKYVPRPAHVEDGLAFVPLTRGEVFAVRLINRSPYDAAAALSLDGLGMYSFSQIKNHKGQPKYSQVIIDRGKNVLIRGWHINNEKSEVFTITEFAKSAAFELKSNKKTGTITVAFAAAWPKGGAKPPDEPANPNEHSRSAGADAVGRGQAVKAKFIEVSYDIGVVREAVSVRYAR